MSAGASGQRLGDRRRQWPVRRCHFCQLRRCRYVERSQLDPLGSRRNPASWTILAGCQEEPGLLLCPPTHRRQNASARRIGQMRILDYEHRGDRDHPLEQVCNQLRYPFRTVLLLQLCHFWAGGQTDVEHDTE